MNQTLAHLLGDYVLQNDWEALNKTSRWLPAFTHAAKYTAAFLPVTKSPKALAVIGGTHLLIDHYRVAIPLSWAKNQIGVPQDYRYEYSRDNAGYAQDKPAWMSVWLMIIADNTLHMLINDWAVKRWSK